MRIHRTTAHETWAKALFARQMARKNVLFRLNRTRSGRRAFRLFAYLHKMRGGQGREGEIYPIEVLWSFAGSFIGISLLAWCSEALLERTDKLLMMGTFGASAMLLFGAPHVPFAQPRNVLGGHVVSAVVGVTAFQLVGHIPWLAAALAVSGAIAAMHGTGTLHPPGGGTALMMATAGPELTGLGYSAVLFPVAAGVSILVLTALCLNNISRRRRYPVTWW